MTTERIALIGLSTPLAYHYDATLTESGGVGWTSMLEGAVGLATLYDELWFVHRNLCPLSMRAEKYVRFLSENEELVGQIATFARRARDTQHAEELARLLQVRELDLSHNDYWSVIKGRVGPWKERGLNADNHSGSFELTGQGVTLTGDAWRPFSLLTDLQIYAYLRNTTGMPVELISNIYVAQRMSPIISSAVLSRVATELLVHRIPSVYLPTGPDLEGVEKLRDSRYLGAFRALVTEYGKAADASVPLLVKEIESVFGRYRNDVLLKRHKKAHIVHSVGRVVLAACMGKVFPGLASLLTIEEDQQTRRANWAAFLAEAEVNGDPRTERKAARKTCRGGRPPD